MSESDERLLQRIARGDRDAMRSLHGAYADRLFRYALLRTNDRELAEDAVQETLLAAWRSAASYQGHSSASTWLFGICRHKVADALRRRDPAEAAGLPEPLPIAGSRDPDLRACLGRLEEDDRELLVLVFHYGFAQREVAEVMGLPVGTVKSRVFYARRKLQALLEEGG